MRKGKTQNKNIEKVQETHMHKTCIHAHTHKTHANTKTIIDKQKRVKVKNNNNTPLSSFCVGHVLLGAGPPLECGLCTQ